MNKTHNINLGGLPFLIDENAFLRLQAYTKAIALKFQHVDGSEEIVKDIEARLAEMLSEDLKTSGRGIISLSDVDKAINVMGKPEEFGQESTDEEAFGSAATSSSTASTSSIKKKLMRDTDRNWLGGVLSGLSAYFGVENPVWFRVIFIFVIILIDGALFMGFPALSSIFFWGYIILWIALPKAITPTQKMQMRGEDVTLSNIEQNVKEEWDSVKKNGRRSGIGEGLSFLVKAFAKVFLIFGLVIAIAILGSLIVAFLAAIGGLAVATPFIPDNIFESNTIKWLGISGLFLMLLTPIIFFAFFFAKLLFKTKLNMPLLAIGSSAGFLIGLLMASLTLGKTATDFKTGGVVSNTDQLTLTDSTLYLSASDNWTLEDSDYDVFRNEFNRDVELNIAKSRDNQLRLKKKLRARGKNSALARSRAQNVQYNYQVSDNSIVFDPSFTISDGQLFRAQEVDLQLEVPEGVIVDLDEEMNNVLGYSKNVEGKYRLGGERYMMTDEGLAPVDADGVLIPVEISDNDNDWNDSDESVEISLFGDKFLDVDVRERNDETGNAERVTIRLNGEEVVDIQVDENGDRVQINGDVELGDEESD